MINSTHKELNTDNEKTEGIFLDKEKDNHWKMIVAEGNESWGYSEKYFLYAKIMGCLFKDKKFTDKGWISCIRIRF